MLCTPWRRALSMRSTCQRIGRRRGGRSSMRVTAATAMLRTPENQPPARRGVVGTGVISRVEVGAAGHSREGFLILFIILYSSG
jgi:hypothetical protein